MTKRHFEAVATIIARHRATADMHAERGHEGAETAQGVIANIARDMADLFADENPRFDRGRFLKACGV